MLKQFVLASMLTASMSIGMSTAATAGPEDECLLKAGCFWEQDASGGHWVCSDPAAYMMCLSPAGVTSANLTFEPVKD